MPPPCLLLTLLLAATPAPEDDALPEPGAVVTVTRTFDASTLEPDERAVLRELARAVEALGRLHARLQQPGALHPQTLSADELARLDEADPDGAADRRAPRTVLRRADDAIVARPYEQAFAPELEAVADALRAAAGATGDPALSACLASRATALTTGEARAAVLEEFERLALDGSPLELVVATPLGSPGALGLRASLYDGHVAIGDDAVQARVDAWIAHLVEVRAALPGADAAEPQPVVLPGPLSALRDLLRAGPSAGTTSGVVHVPSDPGLRAEIGRRTIVFPDALDAYADAVLRPVAAAVLDEDAAHLVSGAAYVETTIAHYLGHRLGPDQVPALGDPVARALGEAFGPVEECLSDVLGLLALRWMSEHDVPTEAGPLRHATTLVARALVVLDDWRGGRATAREGRAMALLLAGLRARGALVPAGEAGRWRLDLGALPGALDDLAAELLAIQTAGDADDAARTIDASGGHEPWAAALDRAAAARPARVDLVHEIAWPEETAGPQDEDG